jgi:hypothetical protein
MTVIQFKTIQDGKVAKKLPILTSFKLYLKIPGI